MQFSGAIYQAPIHNVCGGCLAAEFPTVDGGSWKSQLQRSLMAAVRAVLTVRSAR